MRHSEIEIPEGNGCQWLSITPEFRQWKDFMDISPESNWLIVRGKPGSGKSTLLKTSTLHDEFDGDISKPLTLRHYFAANGNADEHNSIGMFRALLYQLVKAVRPISSTFLKKIRETHALGDWDRWVTSATALKDAFQDIITHSKHPELRVSVYLDALDECNKSDVREVLGFLRSVVSQTQGKLRVCMSTRNDVALPRFPRHEICMEDHNGTDIERFVSHEMRHMNPQYQAEIQPLIIERASNVFLWVKVVLCLVTENELHESVESLKAMVKETPQELQVLFQKLLDSLNEVERVESVRLFQLVLSAWIPLSLSQFRHAYTLHLDSDASPATEHSSSGYDALDDEHLKNRIYVMSKGLLEVRCREPIEQDTMGEPIISREPRVEVIHDTVRDFLLSHRQYVGALDLLASPEVMCHQQMLSTCIQALRVGNLEHTQKEGSSLSGPFSGYAYGFWMKHAAASDTALSDYNWPSFLRRCEHSTADIVRLYKRDLSRRDWKQSLQLNRDNDLLVLISASGCTSLVREHVKHCPCLEKVHSLGPSGYAVGHRAFYQAVKFGKAEIVGFLGEIRAIRAKVNFCYPLQGTALYSACYSGNEEIIRKLLSLGADIDRLSNGPYGSALHVASALGRDSTVELLLHNGALPWIKNARLMTPLHLAAKYGRTSVARILARALLQVGHKLDDEDDDKHTALSYAERGGYTNIVSTLETSVTERAYEASRQRTLSIVSIESDLHRDIQTSN